jgi:hypothetical protein
MSEASRQQRRREAREQTKVGQRHLANGLAQQPKRDDVLAVARVVASKLAERGNARRASEAAALVHALFERSLARGSIDPRIACRAGCNHCCHQFVGAVPPEVFRIADIVRAGRRQGLDTAGVLARGAPLAGLAPAERIGRKLACPLLVDGLCSVYAERPLVCRQTTSFDVAACIEELDGKDLGKRIEVSPAHLDHAGSASVILLGAMRAASLPDNAYELSAALAVALAEPEAERHWLDGADVFRDLARNVPRPPAVEMVAQRIAEALA